MNDNTVAELAELQLRFPAFRILRDAMHGRRRTRYIARRTRDGVHPHTLVTADLTELRDELSRASQPGALAFKGVPGAVHATRSATMGRPETVRPP